MVDRVKTDLADPFPIASHVWVRRDGEAPFEGIVSRDNHRWTREGQLLIERPSGAVAWYHLGELSPVRFPATEPWTKPLRPMIGRNLPGRGFSQLGKVDPVIGRIVGWHEGDVELRGQVWDRADASYCPILTAKERRERKVGQCYWLGVAQGATFRGEFRIAFIADGELVAGPQPYRPDGHPVEAAA
jgi:hypothetical protein